jgi:hypothetical protein
MPDQYLAFQTIHTLGVRFMSTIQIASPDAATVKVYENVHYDQKTYSLEKQIAEQFRETHGGLLPTGANELGGQFWDCIRWREQVADASGHEARFDAYHPCVSKWLAEDYNLRHPVMPQAMPPVPAPHPVPPPWTMPPVFLPPPSSPPSHNPPVVIQLPPGGEFQASSAVPEPLSVWMLGIGLVVVLIACRWLRY